MERGQCHCMASGGLPGTHPISSRSTHSLFATGTFLAVGLVLNLRVGGFVNVLRLHGPSMQNFLKIWQFLPPLQLHWFLQPEVMGIYLPSAGTLGCAVWPGAVITHSQGVPPHFHPPHMNVGTPILPPPPLHATLPLLASLPLIPNWMSVASLNPWLSDFHTVRFFNSSGYYLF